MGNTQYNINNKHNNINKVDLSIIPSVKYTKSENKLKNKSRNNKIVNFIEQKSTITELPNTLTNQTGGKKSSDSTFSKKSSDSDFGKNVKLDSEEYDDYLKNRMADKININELTKSEQLEMLSTSESENKYNSRTYEIRNNRKNINISEDNINIDTDTTPNSKIII